MKFLPPETSLLSWFIAAKRQPRVTNCTLGNRARLPGCLCSKDWWRIRKRKGRTNGVQELLDRKTELFDGEPEQMHRPQSNGA